MDKPCRVRFDRIIRVRVYSCDTISRSTLIFNKRERIKKLEKRLYRLQNKPKKKKETSFLCFVRTN